MLRDIPGLEVAVPAQAEDAVAVLRTCLAAAHVDSTVCVFLEPIGHGRGYGDGTDRTTVTFGNGLPMSLRVARRLAAAGAGVRVFDLRWLAPLPAGQLLAGAMVTGRVLVADGTPTRTSGQVFDPLAHLRDRLPGGQGELVALGLGRGLGFGRAQRRVVLAAAGGGPAGGRGPGRGRRLQLVRHGQAGCGRRRRPASAG